MAEPRAGTILTVMADWADYLDKHGAGAANLNEMFAASLVAARESLARTPDLLPVLKKAGVVDAGAQGFVHFLEGIGEVLDSSGVDDARQPVRARGARGGDIDRKRITGDETVRRRRQRVDLA